MLEVNPAHALIRDMGNLRAEDPLHPALKELAEQLFDNCLLVEGLIEHPERMVARIQSLMGRAASLQAAQPASGKKR